VERKLPHQTLSNSGQLCGHAISLLLSVTQPVSGYPFFSSPTAAAYLDNGGSTLAKPAQLEWVQRQLLHTKKCCGSWRKTRATTATVTDDLGDLELSFPALLYWQQSDWVVCTESEAIACSLLTL